MMLYPAMNKLTEYIPNRYMMVNVVARRARQIAAEAEANGEHPGGEARDRGHQRGGRGQVPWLTPSSRKTMI